MGSAEESSRRGFGELIVLQPLDPDHGPRVQELASDPAIGATSNVPSPYPRDGAETFIRGALARRAREKSFVFAILAEGELVGLCGLELGDGSSTAELGYWVGKPFWGRGYAGEAASQLVDWGFSHLDLERIEAWCLEGNPASGRVLEKAGFRLLGRGSRPESKWGPEEPILFFELSRRLWEELR